MKTQQHVYYIGTVEYYDKTENDSIGKNIAGEYTPNFEYPSFCARITFHKGSDMAMEQIDFMKEMREKKQQVPRYQKPSIVYYLDILVVGKQKSLVRYQKILVFTYSVMTM